MRWVPVPIYVLGVIAALLWLWETYAASAAAPGVFIGLYVLTAVSATGLLVSSVSPRRSLVDLCYYLFFTFFVTGPAAIQVATEDFPWGLKHDPQHAAVATALLALAMVAYELGRALERRTRPREPNPEREVAPTDGLLAVLVVGVVAGLMVIPLAGLDLLLADRSAFSEFKIESGVRGYVVLILKGIALATTVWALAAWYSADPARDPPLRRHFLSLVALGALLVTVLLFNPLVNPRFIFAAAFIALLFMATRPYFLYLKTWAVLGFPFALFYVFPHLKTLSYAPQRDELWQRLTRIDLEYLTRVDFDTFQTSANAVRFVQENGLLGVQNALGSLLFFVPRAIWPDKPIGSGLIVFEKLNYPYVNVSMPLHMEFFLTAGIAGLLLGMLAFGGLVGRLETASLQSSRLVGRTRADVLLALFGGFAIITLRGSLAAVAVFVGIPLGWAVVVLLLARSRTTDAAPMERDEARTVPASFGDWRDGFTLAKRREPHPRCTPFDAVASLGSRRSAPVVGGGGRVAGTPGVSLSPVRASRTSPLGRNRA